MLPVLRTALPRAPGADGGGAAPPLLDEHTHHCRRPLRVSGQAPAEDLEAWPYAVTQSVSAIGRAVAAQSVPLPDTSTTAQSAGASGTGGTRPGTCSSSTR